MTATASKRTISEAAFFEVSPRHLFHCCKCNSAVSMAMITKHAYGGELDVEVYCHGDAEKHTFIDRDGYDFPIKVFQGGRNGQL